MDHMAKKRTSPAAAPAPAAGSTPPAAGAPSIESTKELVPAAESTKGVVPPGALRNRVIERRRMLGSELAPNPKNFREHGPEQTAALRAVLNEIGMAGELLAYKSERGGGALTLINGHKRSGDFPTELWDVAITDLNDAEADKLLAVLDPITNMAGSNPAQLNALCSAIDAETAELQALIDQIGAEAGDVTFKDEGGGTGGKGTGKSRAEGLGTGNVKIRPVLSVAQVGVFEQAILATGNINRGEAIVQICEAYLVSKAKE